jgi:hypothetical protein
MVSPPDMAVVPCEIPPGVEKAKLNALTIEIPREPKRNGRRLVI